MDSRLLGGSAESWVLSKNGDQAKLLLTQHSEPSTQHSLRRFSNLYAPFLTWTAGYRQHALPLAHLIDRPGVGLPFVECIRILTGRVQVDRLGKACIEDIIQEAVGGKPVAL